MLLSCGTGDARESWPPCSSASCCAQQRLWRSGDEGRLSDEDAKCFAAAHGLSEGLVGYEVYTDGEFEDLVFVRNELARECFDLGGTEVGEVSGRFVGLSPMGGEDVVWGWHNTTLASCPEGW